VLLEESVTLTVKLCVPASADAGVHENFPVVSMAELEAVDPDSESVNAYVNVPPLNPMVAIINEKEVPTVTVVPGLID
jgi:hypothetical protein